uniref:Structure-specific endonuclease subunit SLX1 homolog n=1 Tax=Leersia perrieri TaxID=77586 RepID=A0A0D9WWZ4_9ORYZ
MARAAAPAAAKGKRRPRKPKAAAEADAADGAGAGVGKDAPVESGRGGGGGGGGGKGRFFCCYLLRSLCPRRKGTTYIGFTVNPRRRIRQHNGEIRCGAWRTKSGRPWEMVLCIYGFLTNVTALQFEWAWQHPMESLAVRKAAASFKSLGGVGSKVKLAYTMLNLPSWENLNLTVNFFSTNNTKFAAGCPPLPGHMKTTVCSLEDLQYSAEAVSSEEGSINDENRQNQEPDVPVSDEISDHGLLPLPTEEQEEVGIAGSQPDYEDFAPMDWSEMFGVTARGLDEQEEDWTTESSEVQPMENENRTEASAEFCTDELGYMSWDGNEIHETRGESDGSATSPRCSLSLSSDDEGGRILVDGVSEKASFPFPNTESSSSHEGEPAPPLFLDVVDLVTPIACRLGKKGGAEMARIIDLTNSPIVIEL